MSYKLVVKLKIIIKDYVSNMQDDHIMMTVWKHLEQQDVRVFKKGPPKARKVCSMHCSFPHILLCASLSKKSLIIYTFHGSGSVKPFLNTLTYCCSINASTTIIMRSIILQVWCIAFHYLCWPLVSMKLCDITSIWYRAFGVCELPYIAGKDNKLSTREARCACLNGDTCGIYST